MHGFIVIGFLLHFNTLFEDIYFGPKLTPTEPLNIIQIFYWFKNNKNTQLHTDNYPIHSIYHYRVNLFPEYRYSVTQFSCFNYIVALVGSCCMCHCSLCWASLWCTQPSPPWSLYTQEKHGKAWNCRRHFTSANLFYELQIDPIVDRKKC